MGEQASALGVLLSEGVQLHYDGVLGIDFESVVLIHLVCLPGVLGLHHGHYHAHGGGDLAEEDCWLALQTLGDRDLAHVS